MEELYYESNVLRLSYSRDMNMGKAEWRGFLSSKEFRENGLRCLEFITAYNISRWQADQRQMLAIRQQDLQWVIAEFMPQLLASPLRRMAIIVSGDIFNNMAMEQLFKRSSNFGDLIIKEFDAEDEAFEWLKTPIPAAVAQ
ncbi:hypothetical protein ABID22_001190 [Pontibacter aydingkolensis]|uniref:SpoIIAA-like n=1 Tax=Pontibacter aydingkolensis TaxID=1911536 RepID=A0ABS7CUD0_9BACT|nr:hypothetical protein [Pontibacter aydingkolensis]MBW7467097.1 hypothetical protein [Pontibacter aydingkolensis]